MGQWWSRTIPRVRVRLGHGPNRLCAAVATQGTSSLHASRLDSNCILYLPLTNDCLPDMITECALAFVLDEASLAPLARVGGILTPATAFGEVLVKRLESTGLMRFERALVRNGEE